MSTSAWRHSVQRPWDLKTNLWLRWIWWGLIRFRTLSVINPKDPRDLQGVRLCRISSDTMFAEKDQTCVTGPFKWMKWWMRMLLSGKQNRSVRRTCANSICSAAFFKRRTLPHVHAVFWKHNGFICHSRCLWNIRDYSLKQSRTSTRRGGVKQDKIARSLGISIIGRQMICCRASGSHKSKLEQHLSDSFRVHESQRSFLKSDGIKTVEIIASVPGACLFYKKIESDI